MRPDLPYIIADNLKESLIDKRNNDKLNIIIKYMINK